MWTPLLVYSVIHLCYVIGEENTKFDVKNDVETESLYHVADCLIVISTEQLTFRPTVAIDTQNMDNETEANIFNEVIAKKLMNRRVPAVIIASGADGELLNSTLDFGNTTYSKKAYFNALVIIVFDTCHDATSYDYANTQKQNKHLIIISQPSEDCNDKLKDISHIVDKYHITFMLLNVLRYSSKILTFIPKIDPNTCEQIVQTVHINSCINGTLMNKKIFPSKNPTNLNKCYFKVGMTTLYPFSYIENKDSLKSYDRINNSVGCDMEIIKIINEYFNATLDLYYIFRKNDRSPSGYTDVIKYLLNGSLDVCAGGLYRVYGPYVEYSGAYVSEAVTWVYHAERVERSWQNLVGKMNGLYIFVLFYISYSIFWYFICLFDGDTVCLWNTLLYGWGVLFGANTLQDARTMKQKVLNLGYLIMCIHLSAYISIHLYSFLTIKAPPQMFQSNNDVMESGRKPFLIPKTKYFVIEKKYTAFANTSNDCFSFVDCANKTLEHNGLTILLEGNFIEFQATTAVHGEARVLRSTEHILTVYNDMLIRKGSPLVEKFQKVMLTLFEAGITQRLYTEAVGILLKAKADSANSVLVASSYSCRNGCAISLVQLAGAFYFWIIGSVLSCIVFVIEICFKCEQTRQR